MRLFTLLTTPLLALAAFAAEPRVTQADLLRRLFDLDRLMTPSAGERTAMFSSHERPGPDGKPSHFLRSEPDGWQVMAEMDGPGAITRIWASNPNGDIRFILDGKTVIDAPLVDLFDQALPPFQLPLCYVTPGGGHNCYVQIGYAQSCKIVARGCTSQYQINYVTFTAGTQVEAFAPDLSEDAKAALAEVQSVFTAGLSDKQLFGTHATRTVAGFGELKKQEALSIDTASGGGIIRGLYVALAERRFPNDPYALHRCVLRIYVDGEARPSVEAPLIDFFGSGFGPRFYNSLLLGTDLRSSMPGNVPTDFPVAGADTGPPVFNEAVNENRFMYCFFPIPFADAARVEIENLSGEKSEKISLTLYARVDRTKPPEDSLRFNAHFRKEDPCQGPYYSILETAGTGRIVGCTISVDCPRRAWWGAGAEKIWIAGEPSPSYFGTGVGDFLGDVAGLHLDANPLQGAPRVGPYGKNSAYRWLIADCIDFNESVRFAVENAEVRESPDTYRGSVVYWYGEPNAPNFFAPLTAADLNPPGLRIPDAVEVEGHVVGKGWGNVLREKYAGGVELSANAAANISTDQPVQINIPSERDRSVRLTLHVHARRAFESIQVDAPDGHVIGTVQYDRASEGIYPVGVIALKKGDNPLTVRCTPKAILDCWELEEAP